MRKSLAVILLISLMGIGQHEVAKGDLILCEYRCQVCETVDLVLTEVCPVCGASGFTLLELILGEEPTCCRSFLLCETSTPPPPPKCRNVGTTPSETYDKYDANGVPTQGGVCGKTVNTCAGTVLITYDDSGMSCEGTADCEAYAPVCRPRTDEGVVWRHWICAWSHIHNRCITVEDDTVTGPRKVECWCRP